MITTSGTTTTTTTTITRITSTTLTKKATTVIELKNNINKTTTLTTTTTTTTTTATTNRKEYPETAEGQWSRPAPRRISWPHSISVRREWHPGSSINTSSASSPLTFLGIHRGSRKQPPNPQNDGHSCTPCDAVKRMTPELKDCTMAATTFITNHLTLSEKP
ncbi:hypothetical protein E2C01_062303 [Portunus trituberculatus]|uniref:Uncharacterized protein n=1 Tax=Portunus trituberculatus TaxID=210409 RepID=A0A5B7H7I5_PORTR|nr:hypothetical protein [Portunus trituberculatus]